MIEDASTSDPTDEAIQSPGEGARQPRHSQLHRARVRRLRHQMQMVRLERPVEDLEVLTSGKTLFPQAHHALRAK
jgi:hypothetical protein